MKSKFAICFLLLASSAVAAGTEPVRVSLNARLRLEEVAQTGQRDATAVTLRTRLGLSPRLPAGWSALAEGEAIVALDGDRYCQAGVNSGGAGRAVVADATGAEVNQAWIAWKHGQTTVTAGRQRLVLDNARFVGDVGWRQNMQTFDAFTVQDKSIAGTTLTYAYIDRVNRVFGDRHAQGYWRSDSHLVNASRSGLKGGTLTGYAYLLDFAGAGAAQSCATYGASWAGSVPLTDDVKLAYRAEYAMQSEHGSSPLHYRADYFAGEFGIAGKSGALLVGQEVLGSDRGTGFKTPLATLHAFNGWADLFLATPAAGLRDTYLKGSANLPGAVSLVGFQHWFTAVRGSADPGREFNLQLARKFGPRVTALAKYANFRRAALTLPNVQKVWAQVEFVY